MIRKDRKFATIFMSGRVIDGEHMCKVMNIYQNADGLFFKTQKIIPGKRL